MEQIPEPRRRLNILTKAERRRRIFGRLREGWAYDEIAREERVSAERIRQIVSEVLAKRVIDRGADHAHVQLERLMPALRVVGEAIGRGELKAVGPLIKVIDRLDKHQETVVAKHTTGRRSGSACSTGSTGWSTISPPAAGRPRRRGTPTKIISPKFPRNPLKRLDSDEEIQGNPRKSNPHWRGFRERNCEGPRQSKPRGRVRAAEQCGGGAMTQGRAIADVQPVFIRNGF